MSTPALNPQMVGTDTFPQQLRSLCLDRAGVDVRFFSGMPALRRKTAELEQSPATERLSVITRFSLRPAHRASGHAARTRIIVPPSATTGHQLQHLEALHSAGAQIRISPKATRRLTIHNRALALVEITGPDGADVESVQISNQDLVRLVINQFDLLWTSATPLRGSETLSLGSFTDRQLSVLELLATGRTDEQVGRVLGLSSRSVRTEVAAIRRVLGVQSRFEAGMRYAELRKN